MRIDDAGNVGIGTPTPSSSLHVFSSAATPLQVKAEQTNTTTFSQLISVGENSNAIIYMRQGNSGMAGTTFGNQPLSGSVVSGSSNSNGLILNSTHATAPMVFVTGGSAFTNERMRIEGATGNVGIGTTTPGSTLAVHSANIAVITSGGGGNLAVNTTNAQAADVGAWLSLGGYYDATQTTPFAALFGRKENGTSSQYPGYLAMATSRQGTGLVEAMRITSTGNVGIGTTAPSQKLEINGGVMLNTATAQPACAAATRGLIWFVQGAAGVKDRCEVCAKDAADAYAWRAIY